MDAKIEYFGGFFVPEHPQHECVECAECCHGNCFYGDSVSVGDDGGITLVTNCGMTTIPAELVEKVEGGFMISPGEAFFKGAYNALNAMSGIEFPDCEVRDIQSSLGSYWLPEQYERARRYLIPVREVFEKGDSEMVDQIIKVLKGIPSLITRRWDEDD